MQFLFHLVRPVWRFFQQPSHRHEIIERVDRVTMQVFAIFPARFAHFFFP